MLQPLTSSVRFWRRIAIPLLIAASSCRVQPAVPRTTPTFPIGSTSGPFVLVLGVAQDGGIPHAGCQRDHCTRSALDPTLARRVASLAIVDPQSGQRWIIDATPDFPAQLRALDQTFPTENRPGLDGIFLTHAHIGHYTGLMHLGREVMGARGVRVWAMPRFCDYLSTNGPWDQLVRLGNIDIQKLEAGLPVSLNSRITITPFPVPHRDEYSETVGFEIRGPEHSVLFIPDIDKWERWSERIEDRIAQADVAYLDGTFFADGEIPGRSMSEIPHPFIVESLERFNSLPTEIRARIRFIHLNHTNPAVDPASDAARQIEAAGCAVAVEGERVGL